MVWYGTVWSGMVWYGMVWYGTRSSRASPILQDLLRGLLRAVGNVWNGMIMIWYGTTLYGIVSYTSICTPPTSPETASRSVRYMVWYAMVWYDMVWYGMMCWYGLPVACRLWHGTFCFVFAYLCFSSHLFFTLLPLQLPPFRNSDPGSQSMHLSAPPVYCGAGLRFFFLRRHASNRAYARYGMVHGMRWTDMTVSRYVKLFSRSTRER